MKTRYIVFLGLLWFGFNNALADEVPNPTKLGPYSIGHTTMLVTDPSRNPDGTTSASPSGRQLFLDIWYPSLQCSTPCSKPLTKYSLNNPIYDGTHPGYPLLTFKARFPTHNGVREKIRISDGEFPLIIYSHGSPGSPIVNNRGLSETLASYGYVVVGVNHTGNTLSAAVATILGLPNIGIAIDLDIARSQDISFVITEMLSTSADPLFVKHINAKQIGLYGYSAGGDSTALTLAGLASANFPADTRIKAGVAMDGTNDGFILTAADFANVKVPMMLYQDDANSGQDLNRFIFSQLTNSQPKYYSDVSGALHVSGADENLCEVIHDELLQVQADPNDQFDYADLLFVFGNFSNDVIADCDQHIYNGISNQLINKLESDIFASTIFDNSGTMLILDGLKPLMPMRQAILPSKLYRLSKWYVVSFFNSILKKDDAYLKYLRNSQLNKKRNPLIQFAKNCQFIPNHLMNLKNGDKITFTINPNRKTYKVSFSSGNTLDSDLGTNLNFVTPADDDSFRSLALPFSYPIPNVGKNDFITVFANGAIMATGSSIDLTGATILSPFYLNQGSPWEQSGELLLNGLPTIAPLMADLSPENAPAGHGIFANLLSDRAIITYDQVPMCCTVGNAPNTMQVVIHKNGTIELIYGDMSGAGVDYQPTWMGMIGVATGRSHDSELLLDLIDFSSLKKSVNLPSAYEEFYLGSGSPSCTKQGQ